VACGVWRVARCVEGVQHDAKGGVAAGHGLRMLQCTAWFEVCASSGASFRICLVPSQSRGPGHEKVPWKGRGAHKSAGRPLSFCVQPKA